jgi:ubiquinone/menaquinone biosynthesis C-methylase UbiE
MAEKAETKEFFSLLAGQYDEWFSTDEGRYVDSYERRAMLSFLHPESADVLLDVGTGTGVYLLDAARHGAYVVGLDFSKEMLNVLAGKVSKEEVKGYVELVLGDAERLPFREGVFTKIVCNTALEFIPEPEDAVAEFSRVLRADGEVVIGILTSASFWAFSRWLKNLSEKNVYSNARFYTLGKLGKLLKRGKLEITEHRRAVFAPPGCPSSLLPVFEKVDRFLCMRRTLGGMGAFLAVRAIRV